MTAAGACQDAVARLRHHPRVVIYQLAGRRSAGPPQLQASNHNLWHA